jgi:hypothetical protein
MTTTKQVSGKSGTKQQHRSDRKKLECEVSKKYTPKEQSLKLAMLGMSPAVSAGRIVKVLDGDGLLAKLEVSNFIDALQEQGQTIKSGDMFIVEDMLINQATALQSLFARMTERAMAQDHMPNLEGFMRLALRAQNQCRATLETLAAIKNPPVVFARQANINNGGNQQVNNVTPPADSPRTEKSIIRPNELITERVSHEALDTRGSAAAIRTNPGMATVG